LSTVYSVDMSLQTRAQKSGGKRSRSSKTSTNTLPARSSFGANPAHDYIMQLQRTIGNHAVGRLLQSGYFQAKLNIGPANDKYEQEADTVADKVVSMGPSTGLRASPSSGLRAGDQQTGSEALTGTESGGQVAQISRTPLANSITPLQRQAAPEPEEEKLQKKSPEEDEAQGKPFDRAQGKPFDRAQGKFLQRQAPVPEEEKLQKKSPEEDEAQGKIIQRRSEEDEAQGKFLQRKCATCEKEEAQGKYFLQKKGLVSTTASTSIESSINSARGGGRPLSTAERSYYEPRFGTAFSGVKIHTDSKAAQLSRSVNARAFTVGRDIFFGAGQYSSDSTEGKRLMAHELTHVVQQKGRQGSVRLQRAACLDPVFIPLIGFVALDARFSVNSHALSPGIGASISRLVKTWHHRGGHDIIRIDGFASIEGEARYNRNLSCQRADALKRRLMRPTNCTPGIPGGKILILAHGETRRFDPGALGPNRRAQVRTFSPYSFCSPFRTAGMKVSSRARYAFRRSDASWLYGHNAAANLVPAVGFSQSISPYCCYKRAWRGTLSGNDCGVYASSLISLAGRMPKPYPYPPPATRSVIGFRRVDTLSPGQAYFISPTSTGGTNAIAESVSAPWDNTQTVMKGLTNFHVAAVVARDSDTVITSEVNAAFPFHTTPWFAMYQGNRGFYRAYVAEYRVGSSNPRLYDL